MRSNAENIFAKICLAANLILLVNAAAQAQEHACDLSTYKPLVISHPLVDAALKKVEPLYPATGKNVRVQGEVRVKIIVDRRGNVIAACAVGGHPLLLQSSINAAYQWKFKPNFGLTERPRKKCIQSVLVFEFRLE